MKESDEITNAESEAKNTKKLFKFEDSSMYEDSVNPNGKVIRYRTVFAINTSEEQAREDAKLDVGYVLVNSYELPEGWQVKEGRCLRT